MSCRPELLDPRPPGPFRALAAPRRVTVAKRKHGDRVDRWRWEGDLVGTAGRGWRVVRHVRGRDVRALLAGGEPEPQSEVTLRWLGTHAPATILVKLDDAGSIMEVKVDAALPVPFRRGRFVFTDLDVDVVRDAAGCVTVRDWDTFAARAETLGYTDASRRVAEAGESFGRALLAAWEPTLGADVAAILAATGTQVGAGSAVSAPAAGWLRRAGRLDCGGGETVLWSVAEGRRGRRWRSLRRDAAGGLVADLLLEVDPCGRWTRLELTTAAGILTLHPEPDDAAVHGNVVTEAGVVPLSFAWSPLHRLVVAGEPVADAALDADDAEREQRPGVVVDGRLAPELVDAVPARRTPPRGLPGPSWPLELDDDVMPPR